MCKKAKHTHQLGLCNLVAWPCHCMPLDEQNMKLKKKRKKKTPLG